MRKIAQIFVAFSEKLNFKGHSLSVHKFMLEVKMFSSAHEKIDKHVWYYRFFTKIATFIVIHFFNLIFQIRSDNGFDDEEFKGFLVQARNAADNKAVGRFILPNNDGESRMQHLGCSEDQKEVIFRSLPSCLLSKINVSLLFVAFHGFDSCPFSFSVQKGL